MKGIGLLISVGKWGGLHFLLGKRYWSKRICLGFVALTYFPCDGDQIIEWAADAMATKPKDMRQFVKVNLN